MTMRGTDLTEPTAETLERLCKLWLEGEVPGPVLADAFESAGWPWEWRWNRSVNAALWVGGVTLAEVWWRAAHDDGTHSWGYDAGNHQGIASGAEQAQQLAEMALRRALLESTP